MREGLLIQLTQDDEPRVAVTITPMYDGEEPTAQRAAEVLEKEFGASEYQVER